VNNKQDITVRPATEDDIPAIVAVWHQATDDFLAWMPNGFGAPMREPFEGDEDAKWATWLREALGKTDFVPFVAVVDSTVRGFVNGEVRRVTDDFFHAPYLYIDHLYVDREYRRTGIGRALTGVVEQWARKEGMRALDLEVGELNNPGKQFYASLGFSTLTRRIAKILGT